MSIPVFRYCLTKINITHVLSISLQGLFFKGHRQSVLERPSPFSWACGPFPRSPLASGGTAPHPHGALLPLQGPCERPVLFPVPWSRNIVSTKPLPLSLFSKSRARPPDPRPHPSGSWKPAPLPQQLALLSHPRSLRKRGSSLSLDLPPQPWKQVLVQEPCNLFPSPNLSFPFCKWAC